MNTYFINNRQYTSPEPVATGAQLLAIADLSPAEDFELLLETENKEFEYIRPDEQVKLGIRGIEKFRVRRKREVSYQVSDKTLTTTDLVMTVREILESAGYDPQNVYLKEIRGNKEVTYKDDLDTEILIRPNMKFIAMKKGPTPVA